MGLGSAWALRGLSQELIVVTASCSVRGHLFLVSGPALTVALLPSVLSKGDVAAFQQSQELRISNLEDLLRKLTERSEVHALSPAAGP